MGPMPTMNVVEGPSAGSAIDELTKMVWDLQIAPTRRESGGPLQDQRPPFAQSCMWCDNPDHLRRECGDFQEYLRRNIVYLWNKKVYSTETRRPLGLNQGRGVMRRLMEEAEARHVHYSTSAGIRVGKEASCHKEKGVGFWSVVLDNFSGVKLEREEACQAEKCVKRVTGVVKIFVHRRKHEQRERNRGVHRCTRTCTICKILIKLM